MARDGEESVRLVIDLIPGSEPIAGRLLSPDGVGHEFYGWIELTQVIDHVKQSGAG